MEEHPKMNDNDNQTVASVVFKYLPPTPHPQPLFLKKNKKTQQRIHEKISSQWKQSSFRKHLTQRTEYYCRHTTQTYWVLADCFYLRSTQNLASRALTVSSLTLMPFMHFSCLVHGCSDRKTRYSCTNTQSQFITLCCIILTTSGDRSK